MIREFQREYRWLSNFTPVRIKLNGLEFPSVEHAYMSAKSDNPEWKRFCADPHNTAGAVKRMSKAIKLVEGWDDIKLVVMGECLVQKFNQEPFRTKLLDTGTQHIQEGNRWNDKFWGVCLKTNEGQNHLGELIMEIRGYLR